MKKIWQKNEKRQRKWMRYSLQGVLFALCFLLGRAIALWQSIPVSAQLPKTQQPPPFARLAVVIDDFGYHGEGTEEMLSLSIPFTAAVMPFSAYSKEDAGAVEAAGKEAIIHMPMESLTGKSEWVGEKGIFRYMNEEEIRSRIEEAFSIVPKAVGMNNHMGSAVMEDKQTLKIVMEEVGKRQGFFLDSMTSPKTKGAAVAGEGNVPFLQRDVFLDSTDSLAVVKENIRKAAQVAKDQGSAIAIGHVGPEGGRITAQALEALAPILEEEGVQFVFLSELAGQK